MDLNSIEMALKTTKYLSFIIFLSALLLFNITKADCKSYDNKTASKMASTISLIIHHQEASGNVTLKRMNFQNGDFSDIGDFKFVGNKTFVFQGDFKEPNFYKIDFFGRTDLDLILSPGQDIKIEIDLLSPDNFIVSGTNDTQTIYNIGLMRKRTKDSLVNPIIKELIKAQKENNSAKIVKLTKLYIQKNEILKNELKQQLKTADIPVIIYSSLKYFDLDEDINFLDSLSTNMVIQNPGLNLVKYFRERVKKAKQLTIGAEVPNIYLPDQKGNMVNLFSLKGKYVLLDFWASWNKQCRENNREYQGIYNKYKSHGFEILSISLDEDKNKWLEAIKTDIIPWVAVSDLKGLNSEVALKYNITKLPQNYLIDKEGHILAKNLKGSYLEKKLSEVIK